MGLGRSLGRALPLLILLPPLILASPLLSEDADSPAGLVPLYVTHYEARALETEKAILSLGGKILTENPALRVLQVAVPPGVMEAVERIPSIWLVQREEEIVRAFLDDSLQLIDAVRVHAELGVKGQGQVIAVLDTGIDDTHPDFRVNTPQCKTAPAAHVSFPNGPLAATCNRIIAFYNACQADDVRFPNARDEAFDDQGHGTHVAGIAAGNGEGSNGKYMGMAPEAKIVGIKMLNFLGTSLGCDIGDALRWLANLTNPYSITVANASWGSIVTTRTCDDPLSKLYGDSLNAGIVPVAAAGNTFSIACPAGHKNVTAVGAVDENKKLAIWSGKGPAYVRDENGNVVELLLKPNVAAPGINVWSAYPKNPVLAPNGYRKLNGTSMASPHVAGLAALVRAADTAINVSRTVEIIERTAEDIPFTSGGGNDGPDYASGHGLIQAYAAVSAALDGRTFSPPNGTPPPGPLPNGTLTGRIYAYEDPSHSIANAAVELYTNPGGYYSNGTETNAGGTYLLGAPQGDYTLRIRPPSGTGYLERTIGPVTLTAGQTTTFNASVEKGVLVKVKVHTDQDGNATPVANAHVSLADRIDTLNSHHATTNATGIATFQVIRGQYRVLVESNASTDLGPSFEDIRFDVIGETGVSVHLKPQPILEANTGGDRTVTVKSDAYFDARKSRAYPDTVARYRWNVSGYVLDDPTFIHVFQDIDTYIANLTVWNTTGASDADTARVYANLPGHWNTRVTDRDAANDDVRINLTLLGPQKKPWADFVRRSVSQNESGVVVHLQVLNVTNSSARVEYVSFFRVGSATRNACLLYDFASASGTIRPTCANSGYSIDAANNTVSLVIPLGALGVEPTGTLILLREASATDYTVGSPTFLLPVDDIGTNAGVAYTTALNNELPNVGFTITPASPNATQSVTFTDASTDRDGSVQSWYWAFGDGFTSAQRSPTHTYDEGGCYWVKVTATDDRGSPASREQKLLVRFRNGTAATDETCRLTAVLKGRVLDQNQAGLADIAVNLTRTDGTRFTTLTDAGGNYSFRAFGGTYTLSTTPPAASLHWPAETTVTLQENATTSNVDLLLPAGGILQGTTFDASGSPLLTRVQADNLTVGYLRARFTDAGGNYSYKVRSGELRVVVDADPDALLQTSTAMVTVPNYATVTHNVTLAIRHVLEARAEPRQSTTVGTVVSLNASRSIAQPGAIVNHTWQFGDGDVGYGSSVTHAYAAPGEYLVNLTITNSTGSTHTVQTEVYVSRAAQWNHRLVRTDPQLDQADAYGDIVRITSAEYLGGPRSTTHLELRMGVRDLALPVNGTARYEVKFETSTNSGYTLCAEVEHDWLRGYSVTPGLACQNTDAFLDFAEDEVGLRMACPALALTGTCVYGVHSFQGKVTRNGSTLDQTSAGDPQSVYRIVNQSEPPLALFTWTPANPTTSDWIQLLDRSSDYDGQAVNWTWSLATDVVSYDQHTAVRLNTPLTYLVRLNVRDNDDEGGAYEARIPVGEGPL